MRLPLWIVFCFTLLLQGVAFASGAEIAQLIGDDEQLIEPVNSSFRYEIQRLFPYTAEADQHPEGQSRDLDVRVALEVADLRASLAASGQRASMIEQSCAEYRRYRLAILSRLNPDYEWSSRYANKRDPESTYTAAFQIGAFPAGIPREFQLYLEGANAFIAGDTLGADCAWRELLSLPESERHYRGVWAAFMLGRLDASSDQAASNQYYALAVSLADAGASDPLHLAGASLGAIAQSALWFHDFAAAIHGYLQQVALGVPGSLPSLNIAAQKALLESSPEELASLAENAEVAPVLTAFLLNKFDPPNEWGPHDAGLPASAFPLQQRWLEAVEAASAPVIEADRLAWIAYQTGDYDLATRWLAQATTLSPHGLWVKAKLALRQGHRGEAKRLLVRAVKDAPEREWTANRMVETYTGSGYSYSYPYDPFLDYSDQVDIGYGCGNNTPIFRIYGDLGCLQLADGEFTNALTSFLKGPNWLDAAYVAERVLTVSELKTYVARHGPDQELERPRGDEWGGSIRYLLARRLARLDCWREAKKYFPVETQPRIDTVIALRSKLKGRGLSNEDRALTLYQLARIERHGGIQLLGTEVEPDWFALWEGNGEYPEQSNRRLDPVSPESLLPISASERRRITRHGVEIKPDLRFHFRYQAAEHAWEASLLLPDNDERLGHILCAAGWWNKNRDPVYADRFYKALVNRCRQLPIGQEADRIRWFPGCGDLPGGVVGPPVE
ncbi:MAG: hypothetical protein ABI743_01205 [bacterium]